MNFIEEGDEIVISIAEHHSNLIPWQNVARAKKAILSNYMYTMKMVSLQRMKLILR